MYLVYREKIHSRRIGIQGRVVHQGDARGGGGLRIYSIHVPDSCSAVKLLGYRHSHDQGCYISCGLMIQSVLINNASEIGRWYKAEWCMGWGGGGGYL